MVYLCDETWCCLQNDNYEVFSMTLENFYDSLNGNTHSIVSTVFKNM